MMCETYDLINATQYTILKANNLIDKINHNKNKLNGILSSRDIKYLLYLLSMDISYAKEALKDVEETAKKNEKICLSRIFE